MKWRELAVILPEFVQWVVQTQGPLPEEVTQEDYYRLSNLFMAAQDRGEVR